MKKQYLIGLSALTKIFIFLINSFFNIIILIIINIFNKNIYIKTVEAKYVDLLKFKEILNRLINPYNLGWAKIIDLNIINEKWT